MEDGIEIFASKVKPPVVFVSVRIVFGAQYYYDFQDKNEYAVVFSNKGNEEAI